MDSLHDEVKFMSEQRKHVFDWDLSFFRGKPRVFNLTEEQVQEDRAPLLDAVADELRVQDEGGPINYTPEEMASGHFVIVKSSCCSKDPMRRPFWLCQVIQNNTGADSLRLAVQRAYTTLIGHLCIKLFQAF